MKLEIEKTYRSGLTVTAFRNEGAVVEYRTEFGTFGSMPTDEFVRLNMTAAERIDAALSALDRMGEGGEP